MSIRCGEGTMGNTTTREQSKAGILYPMLIIAALAIIAFGVLGVLAMSDVLPRNESISPTHAPQSVSPRSPTSDHEPAARSLSAPTERAAKSSYNARVRLLVPASTT